MFWSVMAFVKQPTYEARDKMLYCSRNSNEPLLQALLFPPGKLFCTGAACVAATGAGWFRQQQV